MARTPKRQPKTRVRELIADTEPTLVGFPLVHTTDAYRFAEVLVSRELRPTPCAVFGEPLLYLFLGRPAYRTRKGANDGLTFDLPVTVVLKPGAAIPTPVRVFPFDTGAYEKGLYREYFHSDTIIEDFAIIPTISSAISYISHFYSTKREYYNGATRKNVDIPFDSFEARGLLELARAVPDPAASSRTPPDERSSSVEVQLIDPISLRGNTLAIVLPQQYLDTPGIAEAIEAIEPSHVKTYDVMKIMGSREIAAVVYHIVRDIYLHEGVMA